MRRSSHNRSVGGQPTGGLPTRTARLPVRRRSIGYISRMLKKMLGLAGASLLLILTLACGFGGGGDDDDDDGGDDDFARGPAVVSLR